MTKRTVVALAALGLLAFALWMPMHARQQKEIAAVRAAIENYMQGHATGDGEFFSKVFHPDSKLFWVRDGQLMQRTSADYIAGASSRPAGDEAQRKRSIESIDITG
ncbi:MAG: nuclear transport factor 2 family protein, partial [Candidatus Acidiferrales bacterium]